MEEKQFKKYVQLEEPIPVFENKDDTSHLPFFWYITTFQTISIK
jgi:hypothetical protein